MSLNMAASASLSFTTSLTLPPNPKQGGETPHAERRLGFVVGTCTNNKTQHDSHVWDRKPPTDQHGFAAAAATILLCSYAHCEEGGLGVSIVQAEERGITFNTFPLCCDFTVTHHVSCTYLSFPFMLASTNLPSYLHNYMTPYLESSIKLLSLFPSSGPSSIAT